MGRRIDRFARPDASALAADRGGARRAGKASGRLPEQRGGGFLTRRLARDLARAQVALSPRAFLALSAILGVALFALAGLATAQPAMAVVGGLIGAGAPSWWVQTRRNRLAEAFNAQLPETLGTMASTVRAGNSLPQALEHVAREAPEPTRSAFARVVREVGLGVSVQEALGELAEAYPSEDLDVLVTAIDVQYQVGGNLIRVLELLAETIRERVRLAGDVRALTSQQRYSAYLLATLPLFVAGFLFVVSPDYVSVMFEPGPLRVLLLLDAALIVLGFVIMRRLARVDF